jgi:aspartate dehydrogenase
MNEPRPGPRPSLSVGIGSIGTVGMDVARALQQGVDGLHLGAVSARDTASAAERLAAIGADVPVIPLDALARHCDVVVECAPSELFLAIATPAVELGRVLIPIGVGALSRHLELAECAAETGARIIVPSGAIAALDALRAAAEGEIHSVRMVTRKPPGGLAGAPYLVDNDISLEGLNEAQKVFEGSAAEGARGFPANVNVAAAVGLAGIGPDRTVLEIWADPGVQRNQHTVTIEADSVRLEFKIENVPTKQNPRTGALVAKSVVATLRRLVAPLVVGT